MIEPNQSALILPYFMEFLAMEVSEGKSLNLWGRRSDIRAFIFEPEKNERPVDTVESDLAEISLPFPVCYFEIRGEESLVSLRTDGDGRRVDVYSAVFAETNDGSFEAWVAAGDERGPNQITWLTPESQHWSRLGLSAVLADRVSRLKSSALGQESVAIKCKARTRNGTEFLKLKKIIRVCGRARAEKLKSLSGVPIDWSHRWEVMGHWRKLDGVGRDRLGNRTIDGRTWVKPHCKGPEGKPLVVKTRNVDRSP